MFKKLINFFVGEETTQTGLVEIFPMQIQFIYKFKNYELPKKVSLEFSYESNKNTLWTYTVIPIIIQSKIEFGYVIITPLHSFLCNFKLRKNKYSPRYLNISVFKDNLPTSPSFNNMIGYSRINICDFIVLDNKITKNNLQFKLIDTEVTKINMDLQLLIDFQNNYDDNIQPLNKTITSDTIQDNSYRRSFNKSGSSLLTKYRQSFINRTKSPSSNKSENYTKLINTFRNLIVPNYRYHLTQSAYCWKDGLLFLVVLKTNNIIQDEWSEIESLSISLRYKYIKSTFNKMNINFEFQPYYFKIYDENILKEKLLPILTVLKDYIIQYKSKISLNSSNQVIVDISKSVNESESSPFITQNILTSTSIDGTHKLYHGKPVNLLQKKSRAVDVIKRELSCECGVIENENQKMMRKTELHMNYLESDNICIKTLKELQHNIFDKFKTINYISKKISRANDRFSEPDYIFVDRNKNNCFNMQITETFLDYLNFLNYINDEYITNFWQMFSNNFTLEEIIQDVNNLISQMQSLNRNLTFLLSYLKFFDQSGDLIPRWFLEAKMKKYQSKVGYFNTHSDDYSYKNKEFLTTISKVNQIMFEKLSKEINTNEILSLEYALTNNRC